MSNTTTNLEVSPDTFRSIELEPIGYPIPTLERNHTKKRTSVLPDEDRQSLESLTDTHSPQAISKWSAALITGSISCITLISSMLGGILVVCLPTMARDIHLSHNLLLWPAGVNSLACGCMLLISGSVADVVGGRKIYLLGEFLLVATTIACGVCTTGIELIIFRAAQGVALSLCLPSSVSIITKNIPTGSWRNIAFACLGAGQPVGFAVGLVMGGVFVDNLSWRWGYYIGAILTFIIFIASIFGIPLDEDIEKQSFSTVLQRLKSEIDWIGCSLISTSLGMFSYVFAMLASGASAFLEPASLALFSTAVVLIPAFAVHINRQERLKRAVVLPPSLLKNRVFTTLCITVFLVWGVFNSVQYFLTLFFQSIQQLSAIQTSVRFLPMVITGAGTNFITGWLVKRLRADHLLLGSAALTTLSPLLLAIIHPSWTYFACTFFAVAFAPISADVLFTVANLLITSVFPSNMHGLAGGVFNTISNIGESVGLAVMAVVASSVTLKMSHGKSAGLVEEMDGYRVTFWLCFGINILILAVVAVGLRGIGKVGIKTE